MGQDFPGPLARVRFVPGRDKDAALSRLQGRAAVTAGVIGAGTSLLTGVTRAAAFEKTGKLAFWPCPTPCA